MVSQEDWVILMLLQANKYRGLIGYEPVNAYNALCCRRSLGMKFTILWLCVTMGLLAMAENVWAHGVRGRISAQSGLLVEAEYDDGEPMSYASIEIFDSEEKLSFQTGRTDRNGRFLFYPDKMGDWKVVVSDGMGHRLALKTDVDKSRALKGTNAQGDAIHYTYVSKCGAAVTGTAVIFGISGILFWWRARKRGTKE